MKRIFKQKLFLSSPELSSGPDLAPASCFFQDRLLWLQRAVPSATLDKIYIQILIFLFLLKNK